MSQEQNAKEKKKKSLHGDEKRQVSLALDKAWIDYYNLSKEQEPDKKRIMHYERVIHNFERRLGLPRAILSYDRAILLDKEYIEALNNRAVAYYKKNKTDIAISELKNILKINYDYVAAHHNILKLTLNPPAYNSFWSYWMGSLSKKIFAGLLISLISGIILFVIVAPSIQSFIYPYSNPNALNNSKIETTTNMTRLANNSTIITKNVTNEVKPLKGNQFNEIPVSTLVSLAVAALLLLSPIIRSAKVGAGSFELTTVDRNPDRQLELEFVET